jgi:hypothetical protein
MTAKPQILSDGNTVTISSPDGCLGRFSVIGAGNQQTDCLNRMGLTMEDWDFFRADMLHFHGVFVGDEHRPKGLEP